MQRALTSSPSTRRAPDERSLIQWRVILFWPQRRRDAAKKGLWQAFYRQQQAAKWLPGLQAAPTIRQPRRLDLQGVLPHHLTMAQVPGLGGQASASTMVKLGPAAMVSRAYCNAVLRMSPKPPRQTRSVKRAEPILRKAMKL